MLEEEAKISGNKDEITKKIIKGFIDKNKAMIEEIIDIDIELGRDSDVNWALYTLDVLLLLITPHIWFFFLI